MHLVLLLPCLEHSGHSQFMQHKKLRAGTYTEEVPEWFNLSHASACSQLSNPFSAVIESAFRNLIKFLIQRTVD